MLHFLVKQGYESTRSVHPQSGQLREDGKDIVPRHVRVFSDRLLGKFFGVGEAPVGEVADFALARVSIEVQPN
jgi:hypothetical protein